MSGTFATLLHRQAYATEYVVPENLVRAFVRRHAEIDEPGIAVRAFRQWLRIDVTAPGNLSIPSVAVAELWRDFVGSEEYQEYHAQAYGRHRKDGGTAGDDEGLALAYALAKADEGDTRHELGKPPLLFRADEECGIKDARLWALTCGHQPCRTRPGERCIHHELEDLVPTGRQLPKQPVFDPGWTPAAQTYTPAAGPYTRGAAIGGFGGP